jgi:hypothetical protein
VIRKDVRYWQLPINLYQIRQVPRRDPPRFAMRASSLMKDAYSFDADRMKTTSRCDAYTRIFTRLPVPRGRRRHRRDRRLRVARVPSAELARTRPWCPHRGTRQCRAGRGGSLAGAAARRGGDGESAHAGQVDVEDVAALLGLPLARTEMAADPRVEG